MVFSLSSLSLPFTILFGLFHLLSLVYWLFAPNPSFEGLGEFLSKHFVIPAAQGLTLGAVIGVAIKVLIC